MFYSQCFLSRKGPLGAVWVAAYCHKRLKKNQVTQTDIALSVDKILLDGVPVITYRVLGYLLLGVVRIYSKKVEYLFDDCHDVLMKIKKFLVGKKFKAQKDTLRAPYYSITLPDRYELDAFDFEVGEEISGDNVVPREDIMLKDAWINVGVGNYSLDEYHCEGVAADTLAEDTLSPHPMDIVMVVSHPSHNLSNSEEFTDNLEENRFFHEKGLEFEMFNVAEEEYPDFVRPIGEEHQSGKEYPDFVRPIGEEHQNGEEQRKVPEKTSFENAKYQVITEDYNSRNLEASIEMLRDKRFSQEECVDLERFGGAEEEPPDLVRNFDEEHDATNATPIKSLEMTSSENRKHHFIAKDHPLSITVDATPEYKFPDASGATTPEFMVISTPANKERARTPSKRKCFLDNDVVLANKVLRESIHDSSGLVCKRRKVPHSALDAWKACRIPNLSQGFLEPLFPCTSLELGSIFYKKKSKTREPVETVETPERLDLPGSTVDRSSVDFPGSVTAGRYSEQSAIAPETPVQRLTPMELSECPEITNSDKMGPMSSLEAAEKEIPLSENQELDLNLMNEEIILAEGDLQELHGWSVRTRKVARYLRGSFLNRKKQREEEVLNLLQVLEGRTRKESARLFYEILVLKSNGIVDVKQDNAYEDVLMQKLPGWEQFCEVGSL